MDYKIVEDKHRYIVLDKSGKYEINLAELIFNFVIKIIQYLKKIPKSNINNIVISQLTKAVTSMGANYEEAHSASNRSDFADKITISLKEAKAANYWLRIIKGGEIDYGLELDSLIKESGELRNILGNILERVVSKQV